MVVFLFLGDMLKSVFLRWLAWKTCFYFYLMSTPFVAYWMIVASQDMSQNPPCQELVAKDLHGTEWHFRHIFRG
jgi:hypothetical protein